MTKRGETVVSQLAAAVVVASVLPAACVAGQASSALGQAILRADEAAIAKTALTYVVFTAVFGAVLAMLASGRFEESRRRMCAAWGVSVASIGLFLFAGFLVILTLSFLQMDATAPSTERQLRAQIAWRWLPILTLVTYIAALAFGFFSPAKPVTVSRRPSMLAGVTSLAMPSVLATMLFVQLG